MKGGKFEFANRSDFSDAITVHTVETTDLGYNTSSVKYKSTYRYARYVSPADARCNISELEFYGNNGKLQGVVMGTSGATDKVFDGDVYTFYESESDPSWVGMDFGEPRQITKIRYLPCTNENGIYEGHVYELFPDLSTFRKA
jgi:hypothetical protein